MLRVERQLADDDCTLLDVKTENSLRELPLYPLLRRVLVEHKLAQVLDTLTTTRCSPPAVVRRSGYRNARRAFAAAVAEAGITVAPGERLSLPLDPAHGSRRT